MSVAFGFSVPAGGKAAICTEDPAVVAVVVAVVADAVSVLTTGVAAGVSRAVMLSVSRPVLVASEAVAVTGVVG